MAQLEQQIQTYQQNEKKMKEKQNKSIEHIKTFLIDQVIFF